jgi:hypothetical protein
LALAVPPAETGVVSVKRGVPYGFVIANRTVVPAPGLGVIVTVMTPLCVFW